MKRERIDVGSRVRVVANNVGHSYEVGKVYIVSKWYDRENGRLVLKDEKTGKEGGSYTVLEDLEVVTAPRKKAKNLMQTLVIPDDLKELILNTISQAKADKTDLIFRKWGFDSILEKGKGVIILLWGPPGTGKTMCAEGIAEILKLDYIILGSKDFQSSVPGQTERNIQKAFVYAKEKNLVVILDECDSVVYNRDEVGAILASEINALLSEIERFDGVCILTTNRAERLDPALERRVCLKLEFDKPDVVSRHKIWRNLIPKKAPLDKCVDLNKVAEYELTGGQIKNAILLAARQAASRRKEERIIRHIDLLEGIKREIMGTDAWSGAKKYRVSGSQVMESSMSKSMVDRKKTMLTGEVDNELE